MEAKYFFLYSAMVASFDCGASYPAYAESLSPLGVFFYSDECYQAESGDAGGGNFKLTRSATGDRMEVGGGWEGPMESFAATNVRIVPHGSKGPSTISYTFTIPGDVKGRTYTGTISAAEIRIEGVDGKYHATLRRDLTYKPKECR